MIVSKGVVMGVGGVGVQTIEALKNSGGGGSNPPPPRILKSEGKEVERKREKNEKRWGGGLIQLNC